MPVDKAPFSAALTCPRGVRWSRRRRLALRHLARGRVYIRILYATVRQADHEQTLQQELRESNGKAAAATVNEERNRQRFCC